MNYDGPTEKVQMYKVVRNAFIADLIEVCSTPAVFTVKFKA